MVGWLWLCTTFYMGMDITNIWKIFHCGIKRYHNENLMGIR